MDPRLPFERLHRFLVRLHPPRFRRRFGVDANELFAEWVGGAGSYAERLKRARTSVSEASTSLVRAWWEVVSAPIYDTWMRGVAVMEWFNFGARNALRGLKRRPVQTLVVVATIAIAVGANTSLFSVARALLMRDLPYDDAERVVAMEGAGVVSIRSLGEETSFAVDQQFLDVVGLESAAAFVPDASATLTGAGESSHISLTQVEPNFFDVLGVSLPLGQGMAGSEDGANLAVVSHDLWVRAYGSDPAVLGRTLRVNGHGYEIVGVAPPEVRFPGSTEAWLSLPSRSDFYGSASGGFAVAKLRPGVELEAFNALVAEAYASEKAEYEAEGYYYPDPFGVPLREHLVDEVGRPLLLLLGAALIVFVLGGLNLVGVWVNASVERVDELAMRRALGASQGRIFRQLMAETVAVAVLGGVAALILAVIATDAIAAWLPGELPGVATIGVDLPAVLVTVALSLVFGAGFGGVAAVRAMRMDGRGVRRRTDERRTARLLSGLSIGQGALALVLLFGSVLTVRSFQNLAETPLGFETEGTLSFRVRLPAEDASSRAVREYMRTLSASLAEVPGVRAVGVTGSPPLTNEMGTISKVRLPGAPAEAEVMVHRRTAGPGYFEAAGIPVLQGVPFDGRWEGEPGMVLDVAAALEMFGTRDVVGRPFEYRGRFDSETETFGWVPTTVRAVVGQVSGYGARVKARASTYFHSYARPLGGFGVVMRTDGNPSALVAEVERVVRQVDPDVAPYDLQTLRAAAAELVAADRALAGVSSGFSVIALLLAGLGLYGLVSQQVTRREREFGVRLALGARPESLIRSVSRRGMVLGLLAMALGVPGTYWVARALESRLFGIAGLDPVAMGAACLFLVGVSTLAAWIPARRIASVDPRQALTAD